jgi:hypothetical protein
MDPHPLASLTLGQPHPWLSFLRMAAKQGPNVLSCMPIRINCILSVSVESVAMAAGGSGPAFARMAARATRGRLRRQRLSVLPTTVTRCVQRPWRGWRASWSGWSTRTRTETLRSTFRCGRSTLHVCPPPQKKTKTNVHLIIGFGPSVGPPPYPTQLGRPLRSTALPQKPAMSPWAIPSHRHSVSHSHGRLL